MSSRADKFYRVDYELSDSQSNSVIGLTVTSITPTLNRTVQLIAELKLVHFIVIWTTVAYGAGGLFVFHASIQSLS